MNEMKYRPEIHGLRALAVALVVLFHAGLGVPGGFVGVDVFFVISGYLITGLILAQQHAGTFRLSTFYARRIRRIVPALVPVVACCLIAGYFVLFPADYVELAQSVIYQQLMISNLFFWQTVNYFNPGTELKPLLHTWSLAVEEQFYLVYPLLLVALARCSHRTKGIVLSALLVTSLALGEWGTRTHPRLTFYLLPTRAWELLLGGLLWFLPTPQTHRPRFALALSLAGLTLILVATFHFEKSGRFPGLAALLPCGGAALLIFSNTQQLTLVGRILACKPLVCLGLSSYSLYLWHWPLLAFARYWYLKPLPNAPIAIILAMSLILAWISWRYIETPFRRIRTFKRSACSLAGIAASVPVVLVCARLIVSGQGVPGRFPQKSLAILTEKYRDKQPSDFRISLTASQVRAGELPSFGAPDATLRCLIWGDSHAMVLVPGMKAACLSRNVRGYQATHTATAPLLNFVTQGLFGLNEKTPEFSRAVIDLALASSVDVVILNGVWAAYAKYPTFEACLQQTIDELRAAGITVVIVLDVAKHQEDIPKRLARNAWSGLPTSQVGVTLKDHRSQNQTCDAMIQRVAQGKAIVLDPTPYFVQEPGFLPGEIDGTVLYRDQSHLSVGGSRRLTPMFENLFDSIAPQKTASGP